MPFTYHHQVRFDETDIAGIVHFSNFTKWVEAAEHQLLTELKIPIFAKTGGFPKVHFSINYRKPARLREKLNVELTLEKLGSSSIHYQFKILNNDLLLASGKLSTVYVTSLGSAEPLPAEWRTALLELTPV